MDLYLQRLEPTCRSALTRVRSLIVETVPEAEETMKYKMPTYAYRKSALAAFASQRHYMSLYVEPRILDRHKEKLQHLNLGRSCIRFKSIDQLPLDIVRQILKETVEATDKRQPSY